MIVRLLRGVSLCAFLAVVFLHLAVALVVSSPYLQTELAFSHKLANLLQWALNTCDLSAPSQPRWSLGLLSCEGEIEPHTVDGLGLWRYRVHASCDERERRAWLLYFHGNAETRAWNNAASKLYRLTRRPYCLNVVSFDYGGFGDSAGSPSEASAIADGWRALEWVAAQEPTAVVLLGHSLGSAVSVGVAERLCRTPEYAATLILEGAFTSLPDTAALYFEPWLPHLARRLRDGWSGPRFASLERASGNALRCIAAVLSVHGDADGIVDISLGQRLFHAAHHSVNGGRNALPTQAWPRKISGATDEFLRVAAGHETALDALLRAGDPAVTSFLAAAANVSFAPAVALAAATAGTPTARAPPPLGRLIDAPPPPAPKLIPGLRSLLADTPCDAPCRERAEDWFEQALNNRGVASIQDVVRLGYADELVGAMAAPAAADEIRVRLSRVDTTLAPVHDEL